MIDSPHHSEYVETVAEDGKARENRTRRAAQRQGYRLVKNPRRDPRAIGFGAFRITDPQDGAVIASFGWDERPGPADRLAQAEAWLQGEEART